MNNWYFLVINVQIFDDHGHVTHYVDGRHPGHSNWMRFINYAPSAGAQNIKAFQSSDGNIYYEAFVDIPPNTEMLVWYSEIYVRDIGLITNVFTSTLDLIQLGKCDRRFCR